MAYIAPNSTIQLFKDIRLSPDSEDTFYFANKSVQNTFFSQHVYATFNFNSYTRLKRNTIKIAGVMVNLYNCNYMRFINTSFENKWFYAFVTKVDYVNNETVEIDYIIDEIQTWLFSPDVTFEPCFIERQHARIDNMYSNLVPENLDLGDSYIQENINSYEFGSGNLFNVALIASRTPQGTGAIAKYIMGTYMPLVMYGDTFVNINNIINQYNDASLPASPEDILGVYMYPAEFGIIRTDSDVNPSLFGTTWQVKPNLTSLDGYVPKNKKLYNYPYKFLSVSNSNGDIREFKWENWAYNKSWAEPEIDPDSLRNQLGTFEINGTAMPPASAICFPSFYEGKTGDWDSGLIINNFPQCAWIGDTFKAWWAQNKASTVTALVANTVSNLAGASMALARPAYPSSFGRSLQEYNAINSFVNAGIKTGTEISMTMAKIQDLKNAPPQVGGSTSESLVSGCYEYKYTARHMCIKKDAAKRIDDYFSLYGYAQHTVARVDLNARENWTYIQTIGCNIHGDLPCDSITAIENKFDEGIRFWKNPLRIGDYSMSNNPMGYQP